MPTRAESPADTDTCPHCGEMLRGTQDLAIEYVRLEHVLEHVVREALGLSLEDLSFVDIYAQCDVREATSWKAVPSLLRTCLSNGITGDLEEMYQVFGHLAKAGALGPMTKEECAKEFQSKRPGHRMAEALERIALVLVQ